jgi:hypothetical protein
MAGSTMLLRKDNTLRMLVDDSGREAPDRVVTGTWADIEPCWRGVRLLAAGESERKARQTLRTGGMCLSGRDGQPGMLGLFSWNLQVEEISGNSESGGGETGIASWGLMVAAVRTQAQTPSWGFAGIVVSRTSLRLSGQPIAVNPVWCRRMANWIENIWLASSAAAQRDEAALCAKRLAAIFRCRGRQELVPLGRRLQARTNTRPS